jgi:hypothetical protein
VVVKLISLANFLLESTVERLHFQHEFAERDLGTLSALGMVHGDGQREKGGSDGVVLSWDEYGDALSS